MRTERERARRFTYANVVSSLALVIAVGGSGAVVASVAVPRNSVGSPQIKNGQVKAPDLGRKVVTAPKIRPNAVNGSKIRVGAVTGTHVKDGSLGAEEFGAAPMGVARAYVWNDNPAATLGVPQTINHDYAYNSSGGVITITRSAVGRYSVSFSGLDLNRGHVQVSGYGNDSTDCKVLSWGGSVSVRCQDPAGALTNSYFTVAYFD